MKKSFVLLIVLVLFAVSIVCYGQTSLMAESDQIQITEQVLYGNKSIVEGVTLQMKNKYEDQMFWDTTYVMGKEPKASTEYTFYQSRQYEHSYWYYGSVHFNEEALYLGTWDENTPLDYFGGIGQAAQDLYDSIGPSERKEEIFYLKDYEDYYQFSVHITGDFDTEKNEEQLFLQMEPVDIERELLYAANQTGKNYSYSEELIEKLKKQKKWVECFQEFFKIPIMDTEVCAIAMEKDADGQLMGWGMSTVSSGSGTGETDMPVCPEGDGYDAFRFNMSSTLANGDAYFTFNSHSYNGAVVDTSLIPGGYGIYHFPYDASKNEIYPEKLQMVYALDPNTFIHDLTLDKSGEHLLLFTEETDGIYMSVIDIATMTLDNKISVSVLGEDDSYYGIDYYSLYEEYMVVVTYDEIVVITIDEDGTYQKEFAVSRGEIELLDLGDNGNTQIAEAETVFDWNGEKLLLANHLYNVNGYRSCNFYVGVADASGWLYMAIYDTSLQSTISMDEQGYPNYNYPHCRPVEDRAMTISWK